MLLVLRPPVMLCDNTNFCKVLYRICTLCIVMLVVCNVFILLLCEKLRFIRNRAILFYELQLQQQTLIASACTLGGSIIASQCSTMHVTRALWW